jgi:hypothetical protein
MLLLPPVKKLSTQRTSSSFLDQPVATMQTNKRGPAGHHDLIAHSGHSNL